MHFKFAQIHFQFGQIHTQFGQIHFQFGQIPDRQYPPSGSSIVDRHKPRLWRCMGYPEMFIFGNIIYLAVNCNWIEYKN